MDEEQRRLLADWWDWECIRLAGEELETAAVQMDLAEGCMTEAFRWLPLKGKGKGGKGDYRGMGG